MGIGLTLLGNKGRCDHRDTCSAWRIRSHWARFTAHLCYRSSWKRAPIAHAITRVKKTTSEASTASIGIKTIRPLDRGCSNQVACPFHDVDDVIGDSCCRQQQSVGSGHSSLALSGSSAHSSHGEAGNIDRCRKSYSRNAALCARYNLYTLC